MTHETLMQRCLDLAIKGLGKVAPNPMVGCVIVHEGKIVGEGYHEAYGQPHAEVNAIRSVADETLFKKSVLYVNLEPCSHFGKTPPCADLIISKGIPKVVIGSKDPNPLVAGKGIEKLEAAGIEVIADVLRKESDYLNRRFMTFHNKKRPYVILKWAQSADGFMALSEPKPHWFTTRESKKLTHKWRSEEQAILAGRSTIEIDDSELTVRLWDGRNPLRVVIDKDLKLDNQRKVFNREAPTIIFNQKQTTISGENRFIQIDFSKSVLRQVLDELYRLGILSVIVEGGAVTLNHFLQENLWDEARIFTSAHHLGTGRSSPALSGKSIEETMIETDQLKIIANTTP